MALGTTCEGFKGGSCGGGCTSARPVLEPADEYVPTELRLCLREKELPGREGRSAAGVSGGASACGVVSDNTAIDCRRLLGGGGLAPLGRATRLFLRSARYSAAYC